MAWVRITFIKILLLFLLPCVLLRFEVSSTLWWKTTIGKTTLQRKEFIYYQEQDFLGNKHCLNPRHWQFYQLFWLIHSTYNLREFLSGQQRSWAHKIFVIIKFTICVYKFCIESKAYHLYDFTKYYLLGTITYMLYLFFVSEFGVSNGQWDLGIGWQWVWRSLIIKTTILSTRSPTATYTKKQYHPRNYSGEEQNFFRVSMCIWL